MTLRFGPSALLLAGTLTTLALTGCSMSNLAGPTNTFQGAAIRGVAHGGYQPLTGAHVYLMGASNSGYGAASTSLLTSGDGTDAVGTYVVTTNGGGFNITGLYSCTIGQQVYLLATGGNPGLTPATYSNSAATLMAALGTCPSSGSFAGQIPFITINEVSTTAAAYALGGFIVDPTHVGSANTTLSKTGMTNAFNNIFNMIDINFGRSLAKTPAVSGYSSGSGLSANGTVPQAKINTLADVAAGCVNSTGPGSAPCVAFFNNTKNSAGVAPADVATALINLAHAPGNAFNFVVLSTATAPFQPTLSAAPNDWTLSIQFTTPNMSHPAKPAIDAAGNVWIPNIGNATLTELSPQGVVYSGVSGFTGSGLARPDAVAIDANSNVWVSNFTIGGSAISEFNSNGTPASTTGFTVPTNTGFDVVVALNNIWFGNQGGTAAVSPSGANVYSTNSVLRNVGITTDTSDNIWVTLGNNNQVGVIYVDGQGNRQVRKTTPTGLSAPAGLITDSSDNLWIANSTLNTVTMVPTGINFFGAPTTGTATSYSVGGVFQPYTLAPDGAGNIWIGNSNGTLTGLTNAGAAISPALGFTTPSNATYSATAPAYVNYFPASGILGVAVAGSGDVWTTDIDGSIYQFVGLGVPTATPRTYLNAGRKP